MNPPSFRPPLPYDEWLDTKLTLQLFVQIVGKIQLKLMPPRNHWWHITSYINARGWTTGPIPYGDFTFSITFDLIEHAVFIETTRAERLEIALRGQPVAGFYAEFRAHLNSLGI